MAFAFKVIGEVQKVVDSIGRARGFGVMFELYFPDGQTCKYRYTGRKKKMSLRTCITARWQSGSIALDWMSEAIWCLKFGFTSFTKCKIPGRYKPAGDFQYPMKKWEVEKLCQV